MKKCIRCGKMLEDDQNICDCGFDFSIYNEEQKYIQKVEEDPSLTKAEKTKYIDNALVTLCLGFLSILLPVFILLTRSIVLFIISLLISLLTMYLSEKPCLVKLKKVKLIGKYLGYIGFSLTVFTICFMLMQMIIK